jgi:arylsulfatase A-like enzyme
MDALRADKLRPFWPTARPEAPSFAALAEKGTRFTSAWAQGNESRSSHASIWTGLYPANHGMVAPGTALDPRWVTLGPAMKSAGLATSGVTANGYVADRWGFGAGWDQFRNNIHQEGSTRGDEILQAGLDSLAAEPKRPWFLYLGTVDTHVSWRGKEPWLARYDPRPYDGPFKTEALGRDIEHIAAGKRTVTERDQTHIIALYDSNVSFQDELLGKLVEQLGAWGVADDTMLIVTADHGDELWEDGRVGHGVSLAETLVHVPLLVVYPPLFPPGTVVDDEVELVDVLPTLCDALGLSPPEEAQGVSLVPLAQGQGRGYPRGAVASELERSHALRAAGWKLRVGASGVPLLYHLTDDPTERRDLAATRPLERRWLTDMLSMFLLHRKEWRKSRWGQVANVSAQMADDLER